MEKVFIDSSLRSAFPRMDQRWEFCDEQGRTVGYFLPVSQVDETMYRRALEQFTEELVEQRRKEPGGRTTAEVLKSLGRL